MPCKIRERIISLVIFYIFIHRADIFVKNPGLTGDKKEVKNQDKTGSVEDDRGRKIFGLVPYLSLRR